MRWVWWFRCKVIHWHPWVVPIVEYNPETKHYDRQLCRACLMCSKEWN